MTEVGGRKTDYRRWEVEKVRRWERLLFVSHCFLFLKRVAVIFMQTFRLPITKTEDRKQRAADREHILECGRRPLLPMEIAPMSLPPSR
jgi:hypothetical protein